MQWSTIYRPSSIVHRDNAGNQSIIFSETLSMSNQPTRSSVLRSRYSAALRTLLLSSMLAVLFFCVGLMQSDVRAESNQEEEIQVIHTVGTAEGFCATTETIAVSAGTDVYYCFTIINSNPVTMTDHTFIMPLLGISRTFQSVIPPGEQLAVTTGYLASVQISLDGPLGLGIRANNDISSTITVYSRAEDEDLFNYAGQGTAQVIVGEASTTVTQTVGTVESSCTDTQNIAVTSGTTVYYCLTLTDTGTLDFVRHEISAPQLGATFVFTPTNPAADSQQITALQVRQNYAPNRFEKVVTGSFANTINITSYTSEGIAVQNSASATAIVGSATAVLTYTVGTAADGCATTNTITVAPNSTVYYCIQLENTGTLPLERFTLNAPQLNLQKEFTRTLGIGATMVLTRTFDAQLAKVINGGETNSITLDGYTADDIRVRSQGSATVSQGNLFMTVTKYARTAPDGCVTAEPLTILTTTQFYYCVVIQNTGTVPIVGFTVTEPTPTNINFAFDYRLEAGQKITLTNAFLANTLQIGSFLGPFLTPSSQTPSLTVTARDANGNTVPVSDAFQITANVPTVTPVPTPTPSLTWTPTLTPIPTVTPTIPPTPTPTNVVVSVLPSATNVLGLDTVATPLASPVTATPEGFVPDSPLPDSPLETPTPTIDFVATENASTAIAITAAAMTVAAQTVEAQAMETGVALTEQALPTSTATPQPTATPDIVVTATDTAQPIVIAIPSEIAEETSAGAISPSTGGTPNSTGGDYLSLIATTLATSTATLSWLWFLAGSIIFFAVAGMFAGLSFRQQERRRYRMFDDELGSTNAENSLLFEEGPLAPWPDEMTATESATTEEAIDQSRADTDDDDYWPASLP